MTTSPNSDKKSFIDLQYAFTRHIRNPEREPAPADIEERRMEIYRGLLYRNVESFIANSFPVIRRILSDDDWHAMIRDYFSRHEAHTPLFPGMPREFLQYLEQERQDENDPPFLLELAHYEWIELAIAIDTREISVEGIDTNGDLLEGIPVLSPLAWPVSYTWPVHQIGPGYQLGTPPEQPTYIVVYRNRDDEVGFIELNPVSAKLLELIQQENDQTGREMLERIARELKHPEPDVVIRGGQDILNTMHARDIILGTSQDR